MQEDAERRAILSQAYGIPWSDTEHITGYQMEALEAVRKEMNKG